VTQTIETDPRPIGHTEHLTHWRAWFTCLDGTIAFMKRPRRSSV